MAYKVKIRDGEMSAPTAVINKGQFAVTDYYFVQLVIKQKLFDEMHDWLFTNTIGKYCIDGNFIIFQKEEDAIHFKLAYGGKDNG